MELKLKKAILLSTIYLLIMFTISVGLYYLSIHLGYKGLAIPLLGGKDDGVFYYENALQIKNGGMAIITSVHVLVLGNIFKMLNTDSIFILKMWNFFGSFLFLIISYYIHKEINNKNNYISTYSVYLIIVLMYVSYIYNSSISILRDIWICNFYLLSAYIYIKFLKADFISKNYYFILLVISIYILFNYRDYAAASFILSALFYVIFNRKTAKKNNSILMIITIISLIGAYYTFFRNFELPFVELSMHDALTYRQNGIEIYSGGSQMNISLDQPNYILFLANYMFSLVSNFIGPLPFQIHGFSSLILFILESIPMLFITLFIFKNRNELDYFDKFLLTQSLLWFMFIGITNDNLGTASRLRIPGYLFILVIFSKIYYTKILLKKEVV